MDILWKNAVAYFSEDISKKISLLQNNLALRLHDLGDYKEARVLLEKNLASDEKNLEKNHPTTAISYSNLAKVLRGLGDYEGARLLIERALASNEKDFG